MNPWIGGLLSAVAIGLGWSMYGVPGVALAGALVVFWMILQFNRALRVMRSAAGAPVGHVPSAVMLNARLRAGMTMLEIVALTRSLGQQQSEEPPVWRWADPGEAAVVLHFRGARLERWVLERPPAAEAAGPGA